MERHFCSCKQVECEKHPNNHDEGCDPCIQKNLELGEIPTCFWINISNVIGTTDYSVDNFTKFYLDHKTKYDRRKIH